MKVIIVCGTDTEIGKTYVANLIIRRHTAAQRVTASYKPIQTGNNGFSEDLLFHQRPSQLPTDARNDYYFVGNARMSSYIFETPVSPHLAAKLVGTTISIDKIYQDFQHFIRTRYDLSSLTYGIASSYVKLDTLVVELAGGILSPVNDIYTNLDLINLFRDYCVSQGIAIEIDLVAGSKLGGLSHILAAVQLLPQVDNLIYNHHTHQATDIVDHNRPQQEQLAALIQMSNFDYLIYLQQYIHAKLLVCQASNKQSAQDVKLSHAYELIKQYEIDNKLALSPSMLSCQNFINAQLLSCDYQALTLEQYQV